MLTVDERLRIEFNDWARAGRGASMERGHRPMGEQAIDLMGITTNALVLDVGCGSGWASRLIAAKATMGRVVGIDISDEMIDGARNSSVGYANVEFRVASAEQLPFSDSEFTHAFSMESLYYYENVAAALAEIHRVLVSGGLFATVVDLYAENIPSHQWVEQLRVPVQVLSVAQYRDLFSDARFSNIQDRRLYDATPVPADYAGGSFKTRDDYVAYKAAGSLMVSGTA